MQTTRPDPFAHRPRRSWRRVSAVVPADLADAAADVIAEITGSGVEIAPAPAGPEGAARETIVGYLAVERDPDSGEEALRRELAKLASRAGGPAMLASSASAPAIIEITSEPLLEEDWGAGWKQHFKPFHAAPRLVVKPTWEPYEAGEGEAVIEMDPGMAFGTGLHASTRLALGLIEELCALVPPERVLDLGTGTGILAMAAALRGAREVAAIDTDPDAVAAARCNVELNRLGGRVAVGGEGPALDVGPFGLIAANITADVLLALATRIVGLLGPGGALVLSGILAGEQAREVRDGFERLGLCRALERTEGEWSALLLFAPCGGEVFEIVDGEGRVIGRAPRSACHCNPALPHRVAHVVVTDGSGRVYLQKRPATKDIQPGKWDTSVGGHLDIGETPAAGARREMQEELGLAGEVLPLYRYLWRTERETELVETFLHEARQEPQPRPGEIDEGRWFTVEEAGALAERGEATPNLAEELRRLRAAGALQGDRGR
jgi:ribosomal protein L11 methyltransferase